MLTALVKYGVSLVPLTRAPDLPLFVLLLAHAPTISMSAPHILRSVIPLIPADTLFSKTYRLASSEVCMGSGIASRWSPDLATLLGHSFKDQSRHVLVGWFQNCFYVLTLHR